MKTKKLKFLLLGCIFSANVIFAQANNLKGKNQSQQVEDEFSLMDKIVKKKVASFQDLADVVIMQRGEFDKYKTSEARIKRLKDMKVYDMAELIEPDMTPLTRGTVSNIAIVNNSLEKGFMFWLTGADYYAMKDAQSLRLMNKKYSWNHYISGKEMVSILDKAIDMKKNIKDWGKKENPYADYGFDSYDKLSDATEKTMLEDIKANEKEGKK